MAEARCVVIAVDGSDGSDFALIWFSQHIYKPGDDVVVVYVPEGSGLLHASKWENAVYTLNRDTMMAASEEEERKIKCILERYADQLQQLGLEGRVRNIMASKPAEGILRAVDEEDAELIVAGCSEKSSLRRTFVGSVSDYLVRHAPCPVVICKRPHKGK